MKLKISELGALKSAEISPRPLTVLVGQNNTGKTYAMYVMWSIFERRFGGMFAGATEFAEKLKSDGVATVDLNEAVFHKLKSIEHYLSTTTTRRLPQLFRANSSIFSDSKITVDLDDALVSKSLAERDFSAQMGEGATRPLLDIRKDKGSTKLTATLTSNEIPIQVIANFIADVYASFALDYVVSGDTFLLPAERGGLNIFAPDLDAKNAALLRHLKRDDLDPVELLRDVMVAQYAEPIDAYLQFLRKLPRSLKVSGAFHDEAIRLQKDISRVRYKVDKNGLISAKPYKASAELGLHLTSSTAKNFYGLWGYLEAFAQRDGCLMIDEPELNLHPDNQRLIARLLARLVNSGIRVVISTHSDYIIREFNNLIMLSSEFPASTDLATKYGYDIASEALLPDKVGAYHFTEKGCDEITVDRAYGMEVASIDKAMNELNASSSELYFALAEHSKLASINPNV
jgi:hypothetical protein